MASSLATFTTIRPSTSSSSSVRVFAGSSIRGMKLIIKPTSQKLRTSSVRSGAVVVKYGDKSVYFDLEDIGNTTVQSISTDQVIPRLTTLFSHINVRYLYKTCRGKFFKMFAAPFAKRGPLLKFLVLGSNSTLAYFTMTLSDILPIKKGPQLPPKLGPCSTI